MTRGTAIRVHEALTSAIAPAVCAAARDVAATGPGHVWIDLEDT